MDFKDLSKEVRLKEEARFNELERNVVNKATKMALDKFSKVYGVSTKVAAQKAELKEFKRNYLSGKIASVLSIDTKSGIKNVPFTILIKASEPTILESDQIIDEKVAAAQGSLDDSINSVIKAQEQKLANLELEQEANNKILADLAKGVSIEAARKEHIFKEAKKENKQERNSLSTATTPTDFLGDVVEYFTYPKTFFPAMKVGKIIDIAGVKYKYIGDEATMTEPAGNTNGTIARFELANKKKASLNKEAAVAEGEEPWFVHTEDKEKVLVYGPNGSFDYVAFTDDRFQSDDKEITNTFLFPQAVAEELAYKHQGWADPWFGPGPKGAAVALASTKENIEVKADEEEPKQEPKKRGYGGSTELTDEVLDSVIGQPPAGYTDTSVNKAIAEKSGREGVTYLTALSRGRTLKRRNENATYRDLLESVTKGDWTTRTKKTEEDEEQDDEFVEEDKFFKDDAAVLKYIEDSDKLEDTGMGLKKGEDLEFLIKRYVVNHGLPVNRVNDILVDVVVADPRSALRALEYLFPDDLFDNETQDDTSIAEEYKKKLFESAVRVRTYNRLKTWFPFAEKYLDLEALGEKPDFYPFDGDEFVYDFVEEFMDSMPSKEELKSYVEKYNVLENIDKKIEEYQKIVDSLEASEEQTEENK